MPRRSSGAVACSTAGGRQRQGQGQGLRRRAVVGLHRRLRADWPVGWRVEVLGATSYTARGSLPRSNHTAKPDRGEHDELCRPRRRRAEDAPDEQLVQAEHVRVRRWRQSRRARRGRSGLRRSRRGVVQLQYIAGWWDVLVRSAGDEWRVGSMHEAEHTVTAEVLRHSGIGTEVRRHGSSAAARRSLSNHGAARETAGTQSQPSSVASAAAPKRGPPPSASNHVRAGGWLRTAMRAPKTEIGTEAMQTMEMDVASMQVRRGQDGGRTLTGLMAVDWVLGADCGAAEAAQAKAGHRSRPVRNHGATACTAGQPARTVLWLWQLLLSVWDRRPPTPTHQRNYMCYELQPYFGV